MKGGPVRATKAGSDLDTPSAREKCREGAAADGAGAFAVLVAHATGADQAKPSADWGSVLVHRLTDDEADDPGSVRQVRPQMAKADRNYTATPGLMSHILRWSASFKKEHRRLPTADERAVEREAYRQAGGGSQSNIRARRAAYMKQYNARKAAEKKP